MAQETWVLGKTLPTWTAVTGSEINSLANNYSILSSVAINNTTNGDTFLELNVQIASITMGATQPIYLGLWLYALSEDGETYGDGQFTSASDDSVTAGINIWNPNAGTLAGDISTFQETRGGLWLPSGNSFKLVFSNFLGATLAASGNVVYGRTWRRQIQ